MAVWGGHFSQNALHLAQNIYILNLQGFLYPLMYWYFMFSVSWNYLSFHIAYVSSALLLICYYMEKIQINRTFQLRKEQDRVLWFFFSMLWCKSEVISIKVVGTTSDLHLCIWEQDPAWWIQECGGGWWKKWSCLKKINHKVKCNGKTLSFLVDGKEAEPINYRVKTRSGLRNWKFFVNSSTALRFS